ncbi:MAG: guanylate kinase [Rickettsiales bacterium]|nr:guanylate kinase [Rickettsiales bacterium]
MPNYLKRRGFMLVLSSPSGGGKTTIAKKLLQYDDNLTLSVSCTTRDPRPKEIEGVDYYFITKDEFELRAEQKDFYEYELVYGNYYGTPKKKVDQSLNYGIDVLFDIDWQGTRRLISKARSDVVSIFILPPSMEELERRLSGRGQDSEQVVKERMQRAANEISHYDEYDYVIVNRTIEESLLKVNHILKAERLRRVRQHSLKEYVDSLLDGKT